MASSLVQEPSQQDLHKATVHPIVQVIPHRPAALGPSRCARGGASTHVTRGLRASLGPGVLMPGVPTLFPASRALLRLMVA